MKYLNIFKEWSIRLALIGTTSIVLSAALLVLGYLWYLWQI
jgi:hypothetical protein